MSAIEIIMQEYRKCLKDYVNVCKDKDTSNADRLTLCTRLSGEMDGLNVALTAISGKKFIELSEAGF